MVENSDETARGHLTGTPKSVRSAPVKSGGCHLPELTDSEREVLHFLAEEFMTPAQISRRRKCSKSAVFQIIGRLKKKGVLNNLTGTHLTGTSTLGGPGKMNRNSHNKIRLHAEEFRVRLLASGKGYGQERLRSNSKLIGDNRVVLYRDSIVVFSFQSFIGDDVPACERQAAGYWLRYFQRLEGLLDVKILKERSSNVLQVRSHYAEMGNELAQDLRRHDDKLRVFGSKDGREWLLYDDSFALDELECTHSGNAREPKEAREDMVRIQDHFNDLRDNDVLKPSQMQAVMCDIVSSLNVSVKTQAIASQQMQTVALTLQALAGPAPVPGATMPIQGRPFYVG